MVQVTTPARGSAATSRSDEPRALSCSERRLVRRASANCVGLAFTGRWSKLNCPMSIVPDAGEPAHIRSPSTTEVNTLRFARAASTAHFATTDCTPELIVASTARRTLQTALPIVGVLRCGRCHPDARGASMCACRCRRTRRGKCEGVLGAMAGGVAGTHASLVASALQSRRHAHACCADIGRTLADGAGARRGGCACCTAVARVGDESCRIEHS